MNTKDREEEMGERCNTKELFQASLIIILTLLNSILYPMRTPNICSYHLLYKHTFCFTKDIRELPPFESDTLLGVLGSSEKALRFVAGRTIWAQYISSLSWWSGCYVGGNLSKKEREREREGGGVLVVRNKASERHIKLPWLWKLLGTGLLSSYQPNAE